MPILPGWPLIYQWERELSNPVWIKTHLTWTLIFSQTPANSILPSGARLTCGCPRDSYSISIPWLPSVARFGFWKYWTLITFSCWKGDVGHPSALLFLYSCGPSLIYLSLTTFQSFYLVTFCIISNARAERNDSTWSCHFNSSKMSVLYLEFNIHQMDHNTFLEILHQNNDVYFIDSIIYMTCIFQHGERNTNSRLCFFFCNTLMSITSWPNGLMSGVLLLWMSTWHFILKFWESGKGRIAVEEYL